MQDARETVRYEGRVSGEAAVGDRVCYEDMANPLRVGTVAKVIDDEYGRQYRVVWDEADRLTFDDVPVVGTTSDLRQHGWKRVKLDAYGAAASLYYVLCASEVSGEGDEADEGLILRSGDGAPEIVWETGPFEWAINVTGGDSIFAGELGNYGLSPEEDLAAALERIRDAGFYFECVNSFTLAAYPL